MKEFLFFTALVTLSNSSPQLFRDEVNEVDIAKAIPEKIVETSPREAKSLTDPVITNNVVDEAPVVPPVEPTVPLPATAPVLNVNTPLVSIAKPTIARVSPAPAFTAFGPNTLPPVINPSPHSLRLPNVGTVSTVHRAASTYNYPAYHTPIVHSSPVPVVHAPVVHAAPVAHHTPVVQAAPAYHAPVAPAAPAYHVPNVQATQPYHAPVVNTAPSYHAPVVHAAPAYNAPVVHAAPTYHVPVVHAAPVVRAEAVYPDEPSPYTYTYAVADDYSSANFNAVETGDGAGNAAGSYSVSLPDGRIQHVNYNADGYEGYTADVTYDGTAQYPVPAPPVKATPAGNNGYIG